MKKLKLVFYSSLLLVVALVFYYRGSIFSYFSPRLASFEKAAVSAAVEEIKKQVSIPPPLRRSESEARPLVYPPSATAAQLTVSGTINRTNIERKNIGNLPPLAEDSQLDEIAELRLEDMFKYQYFAHISPTGSGAESIAEKVGYDYIAIGENLALGDFSDDEDLVQAWMASPGHRENILNTKYEEIGVAVKEGIYEGHSAWIGVQIFGKPVSSCPLVDDVLKAKIDSGQSELQNMQNNLQALKAEIESTNPRSREGRAAYNQSVEQYNLLIANYNALLIQIKSDISVYNTEVAAFNRCLNE